MNLSQDTINPFINKYIAFVDEISDRFIYENNIKHLLYLIIPAFVAKYGVNNENTILNCFKSVKIYVTNTHDNIVTATYNRSLKQRSDCYYTDKFVMINNYSETSLPILIDNIVHEFNHAINSYNNEITYDDKLIKVRTGLSTLNYDRQTLKFINKSNEVTLEEILNTHQTEEIVDIINSFGKYSIENNELANTLFALKHEIGPNNYTSDAYVYQKNVCSILINNKTFTPTINNLRLKGMIEDIPDLFDNVIGVDGSYQKLNIILTDMHNLILKYSNSKFFKNRILNKIRNKASLVTNLINEYEKKCIFK